jgi:hypothetical protein
VVAIGVAVGVIGKIKPIALAQPLQDISEEQIRLRAYQLWEMAGRPFVGDDRFWREAEAELEFLHARDDMRDHH